jgi:hypothetical protein
MRTAQDSLSGSAHGEGVRCVRLRTPQELADFLGALTEGRRLRVTRDLDEHGRAQLYDDLGECAYYLSREGAEIAAWTWQPVASWLEAAVLQSLLLALTQPLDQAAARELLDRATNRRVKPLFAPRRHAPPAKKRRAVISAIAEARR